MIKILVHSADTELTESVVQALRTAGARSVEAIEGVALPRKPVRDERYLVICESPSEKLVALTPSTLPESEYAGQLKRWHALQEELLAHAVAFGKQGLLATQSQAKYDPQSLVAKANRRWGLRLKLATTNNPQAATARAHAASKALEVLESDLPPDTEPMLGYLVQNLIRATPNLQRMTQTINAAANLQTVPIHDVQALEGYRALQQSARLREAEQIATLGKEKSDLVAQKAELESAKADLEAQLKDATEEGELILLQLHQVQEELENYFLKYKDAENRHERLAQRWQQMLKRYPDYVDYESVQVGVDEHDPEVIRWSFHGLASAGVSRATVSFETFVEAGVLGVRFRQADRTGGKPMDGPAAHELGDEAGERGDGLLRWPQAARDENEVECIPAGRGEAMRRRASVLRELSSSDWALLKLIPRLVSQAIGERPVHGLDPARLRVAANRLAQALDRLPQTVRHDSIALKNNQINPDYEHLWFVFENVALGDRHWPRFEIRLGASNVQPRKFTAHPKLEIPLINGSTKPFEGWFEESFDDFGAKWELRFDLNKSIMDAGVWGDLAPEEQALVRGLLTSLTEGTPGAVAEAGVKRRDWADWQQVFERCNEMLRRVETEGK